MALTPNQIVAHNLRRAREHRALTQTEAARKLCEWTGTEWSRAAWSAAERSVDGNRIRHFSADDLVAFSLAFDVPVSFFLVPPEDSAHVRLDGAEVPRDKYLRSTEVDADTDRDVVRETLTRHLVEQLADLAPHREAAEGVVDVLKKLETVAGVLSDRLEKQR